MKKTFFLLLFIFGTLEGNETDFRNYMASPMPMKKGAYLEVSPENRNRWMDGPEILEKERENNLKILKERTFPLKQVLLTLITLGLFLLFIRSLPALKQHWETVQHPPLTPQEKAERSLAELERLSYDWDPFYTKLSQTLRTYIEEEYQLPAPKQTTAEFLFTIKDHPAFTTISKESLAQFLTQADKVKYALGRTSKTQFQEVLQFAKEFVSNR